MAENIFHAGDPLAGYPPRPYEPPEDPAAAQSMTFAQRVARAATILTPPVVAPNLKQWRELLVSSEKRKLQGTDISSEVQVVALDDLAYYVENKESGKTNLLRSFIDQTPTEEDLSEALIALRRIPKEDVSELHASLGSSAGPKEIVARLQDLSEKLLDRFFQDYSSIYEDWNSYLSNGNSARLQMFANKLLDGMGIPMRKITLASGETVPVIAGLSQARASQQEKGAYLLAIAALIYKHLTASYSMYHLAAIRNAFAQQTQRWTRITPETLSGEVTLQDREIARSFLRYVVEKAEDHSQRPTLLWLNESTTDRYFGRDQIDPAFAESHGIVQHINDKDAIRYLGEHRDLLRAAAERVRQGHMLNPDEADLVDQVRRLFKVTSGTRTLPLKELKIKSGANGHNMSLIVPMMDDVVDLAEILGMDIVFADISPTPPGRSQQYARAFMKSRGVPVSEEGTLAGNFVERDVVNFEGTGDFLAGVPIPDRAGTQVHFINYDPNENRSRATGDDAMGFTTREDISPDGLYAHFTESDLWPSLNGGGLTTLEEEWKREIIEVVVRALQYDEHQRQTNT